MPDFKTIKNTIQKRIPQAKAITVTEFLDAVGVGVAADVNGEAVMITERLPKEPLRSDVLNAVDSIAEKIRIWGKHQRPQWMRRKGSLIIPVGLDG